MCWYLAKHAEIVRRAHQPLTKVVLPHTVHEHPGRQRIGRIDHRLGQLFTPAALIEMLAVFAGDNTQKPARRHLARLHRIAAQGHFHILAAGVAQRMGKLEFRWCLRLQFLDLHLPVGDLFLDLV